MKNKLLVLFVISAVMIAVVGCSANTGVQINSPATTPQAGTTAPGGQVTVPGFSVQFNAPGPNSLVNTVNAQNRVAGILVGIWHGIISPVTLIISFINPNVQMYEVHNNGSQYNFGFLIGVALVFLILGIIGGRRRR